jgi:predicted lactoylglutathione lyase
MFDHVTIRVADRAAAEAFYDTVFATLGFAKSVNPMGPEWDDFALTQADAEHPPTENLHIGFVAPSRPHVDDFWRAGVDAGYHDDGRPGPRPEYGPDYYGGFLRDPDGNSVEAVHLDGPRIGGHVDHLWIRTPNVLRARAFYMTIAPYAGLRLGSVDTPGRVQFRGSSGSFSLVAGRPTRHLHLAFTAGDVDGFHATGVAAGYASSGEPGKRPQYHPGYYAAFLFDPDGHNVEVVDHHR